MKTLLLTTIGIILSCALNAQTTVTFKPGPQNGKDTYIFTTYGYNAYLPAPAETLNFGNKKLISYSKWTYNTHQCPYGTTRFLIRFDGLNNIPSGAEIIYASLKFYGMDHSNILHSGNSNYPNSPHDPNKGLLKRVTSNWNEQTVTWNNQPSTTASHGVSIPASQSQWNWNVTLNVTQLVQDIVTSGNNYGFLAKLQNESTYRSVLFASSDHPDSELWPELTVVYCNSNFTYCSSTNNPYAYHFTASASGPSSNFFWSINGQIVGQSAQFDYTFTPGNYKVCLINREKGGACETCLNLCIPHNRKMASINNVEKTTDMVTNPTKETLENAKNIKIYPNPTRHGWKVDLMGKREGKVYLKLFNLQGKSIFSSTKKVREGQNSYYIPAKHLSQGIYFLKIIKGPHIINKKLQKK